MARSKAARKTAKKALVSRRREAEDEGKRAARLMAESSSAWVRALLLGLAECVQRRAERAVGASFPSQGDGQETGWVSAGQGSLCVRQRGAEVRLAPPARSARR